MGTVVFWRDYQEALGLGKYLGNDRGPKYKISHAMKNALEVLGCPYLHHFFFSSLARSGFNEFEHKAQVSGCIRWTFHF